MNGWFKKTSHQLTREKAVVDYIITPHDSFQSCLNFEVILMSELLSEFYLFVYIFYVHSLCSASKPSDHFVLYVDVILDKCNGTEFTETAIAKEENPSQYVQSKKLRMYPIRLCKMKIG